MLTTYPAADQSRPGNNAGAFLPGPMRGVLHTTEGAYPAGAFAAYKLNNSWPHFTVDQVGRVYQHLPIDRAARSMQNQSGGVETNRLGAIQIEVVGFAAQPNWPLAQAAALILLMRWIEAQTGIKPVAPVFGDAKQYGLKNPLEFTPDQWNAFNGWCGHQHVPENSHWDPGAIPIANLLPTEVTMPDEAPPVYKINRVEGMPLVLGFAALCDSNGKCTGYLMVGADGGVFSFGPGGAYFGRVE
jgi:hypothetical protein